MLYDRKIKYVHMYEKDEKIQNVGFVKLELIEDKINVQIHIAGLRHTLDGEYVVMAKGNKEESALGDVCLEEGKGCLEVKGLAAEQVAEGIPYVDLREIFMNLSVGVKLRCTVQEVCEEIKEEVSEEIFEEITEASSGEFMDDNLGGDMRNVDELSEAELLREAFVLERNLLEGSAQESMAEKREEMQEEKPALIKARPQIIQEEKEEESMSMATNKWQQLWSLYPHIKPFEDGREYLVVKPRDFVILQNKYYTLSANSFLLHGYYNYEHLIMCRETQKEGEHFYIGVPGNFYEKEKQVAVLFGFESFEGKREPAGNGDFGYYMVRVEI